MTGTVAGMVRYRLDGEKIKRLRAGRYLSTQEIAKIAEVSPYTWNQLELGRRRAQAKTLRKVARALKVDPGEIVVEEE
jgi:transcriptional regulator with XRE-family HTH domain